MLLLKRELVAALDTPTGLQSALQQAIELEHSTIPPYLYALYSLKPGTNTEIASLVSSVVAEEMAHLALAANILNAIGGSPSLDAPAFVPTYPGPLPGGVESQLSVGLEPFAIDVVKTKFMVIEEPEDPIAMAAADPHLTIGQFYAKILAAIEDAGPGIYTRDHARQLTGGITLPEVIPVYGLDDVRTAIGTIVEQGEGTTTEPWGDAAHNELAHFYRFKEIVEGRQLSKTPPWVYDGDPIPFDPSGVEPVVVNPSSTTYPMGSAARMLCECFDYTYTSLLKALHATFNGRPGMLPQAVGLMESLQEQAKEMMATDAGLGDRKTVGPRFAYQPTNPGRVLRASGRAAS